MFNLRAWNIALRTAHIAAMGVLLGGHAFNVPPSDLEPSLWFTVLTGGTLGVLEAWGSLVWFHQGRGLMTMSKLGLLCAVPFLWDHWGWRMAIMISVVVIASVGSHMTAKFRYYSVIYREVIPSCIGPGGSQIAAEMKEGENDSTRD